MNEIDALLLQLEAGDADDLHLRAANTIRNFRAVNDHLRELLKCPDCGNYVWECVNGGAVVGHIKNEQ